MPTRASSTATSKGAGVGWSAGELTMNLLDGRTVGPHGDLVLGAAGGVGLDERDDGPGDLTKSVGVAQQHLVGELAARVVGHGGRIEDRHRERGGVEDFGGDAAE